ncbi:MAG: sialidase family protein, partial [Opitutaceae bacterium]
MLTIRAFSIAAAIALSFLAEVGAAESSTRIHLEIPDASQPQLAVGNDGRVWLAYGKATELFVARSDDGGKTFAEAVKVASAPKLMLGKRRGPRIVAQGDLVTLTAVADELLAFRSIDGGRTWSTRVTINDVATSAREGLHDLALAPDGKLFVTWLDLRNASTQLWGAESTDAGKSWTKNQLVYRSSDKSICECCHPSALFDREGNLAVMWRNSVSGSRDLWMATRQKGAPQFSSGKKLGTGTWTLDACPMDGGRIIALGEGKFASVWQRSGEVYYAEQEKPEMRLGKGKQPVAVRQGAETIVVWQSEADLVSTKLLRGTTALQHRAAGGRFPVAVSLGDNRSVLLAYERSLDVMPTEHGASAHTHLDAKQPGAATGSA